MEGYINYNFERDIITIFKECLNAVDYDSLLKHKKIEFNALIEVSHQKIDDKYIDEIESFSVNYSNYDGNVTIQYRPYRKIHYTVKEFYIDEINRILNNNNMKTYVIRKNLPDGEIGTIVKWDENKECYYYQRSFSDENTGDVTYLTKDQINKGAEFFIEYDNYPEYYGYENPVLSRKDVLDLIKKFELRKLHSTRIHKFEEELRKLTEQKAKSILQKKEN